MFLHGPTESNSVEKPLTRSRAGQVHEFLQEHIIPCTQSESLARGVRSFPSRGGGGEGQEVKFRKNIGVTGACPLKSLENLNHLQLKGRGGGSGPF